MKKYNIIMITIDGARVDFIEKFLDEFPTFKKLKESGTFFNNMITYAPSTIASMYAIFTGNYGSETGVNNYWATPKFKKEKYKTLSQYLKNIGYFTRADSINELVLPQQGWDKLTIHNEYEDNLKIRHSKLIKEMSNMKTPFFLYLHYSKIHAETTKNIMDKYKGEFDKRYYENREKNIQNFLKYMRKADNYLNRIFNEIKKNNLIDNSIIIVLSDHGTGTGEKFGERRYGIYLYDYTLRCFLFLLNKNIFPIKKIEKQIRNIDILPTILETISIKTNLNIKGKSLFPLIKDKENKVRIAFSETATLDTPSRTEPNIGCIRTDKFKIIYNKITKTKEFYDLKNDPREENNLSGKGIKEENLLWYILKKKMRLE